MKRRSILKATLATAALGPLSAAPARENGAPLITRRIDSIGEDLPLVGLGSWITFNVGDDRQLLDESTRVIKAFVEGGGRMIDSSPMYGSSPATIGYALRQLGHPKAVFSAEKVWTNSQDEGPLQMAQSRRHWGVTRFDLMQVHNLVNWEGHLRTLASMKESGELRTIGITTSHGARHERLEHIMATENLDFVQLTYNVVDREVENRLLPLARDRGIHVIVNRPYQRGALLDRLAGKPLPPWAVEVGADSWAQFLLKFVISHPAVTCAIPATTRVDHVRENLSTATGTLPDARLRQRMIDYVASI